MHNRVLFLFYVGALQALLFWPACRDTESPVPPAPPVFELTVRNQFNILQAQFAVFLSDADGKVRAFRWLPADDTAHVAVPDAKTGDRFDCTVAKITVLEAPGSGVRDTSVELTTYTDLGTGAELRLYDPAFLKSADLYLSFTGVSDIDSIIVPDGLTFVRPQASNNFTGHYRVWHSGQIWLRLRINGEPAWRYLRFSQVSDTELDTALDATTLPALPAPVSVLSLPLLAPWDYNVDRVLNTGKLQFLPLGELIRIPGGAIPVQDRVEVFEPAGLPAEGYRLRFSGYDALAGEGYVCDRFFNALPAALPPATFDIQPTNLADNRLAAVVCSGVFDALALIRSNSSTPHLRWEVLLAPANPGGIATYRLPDVPAELTQQFPGLGAYQFDSAIRARAEHYDQLNAYPDVALRRMLLDDPLWQMKAGYTARERIF